MSVADGMGRSHRHVSRRALVGVALGVLALSLLLPTTAQEPKKEVRAVVEELDAGVGTMTVILAEGGRTREARLRTYNLLSPDIPVTDAAGKAVKLTDLKPDDRVHLKTVGDDVAAIRLGAPELYGPLVKVDHAERTLLVRSKIGDRTVTLPPEAKVIGPTLEFRFEDLKPPAVVLVEFAPDQKTVLNVRTGKNVQPAAKLNKGTGTLIDVDRDRATVQILVSSLNGDHSALRDLPVTRDAGYGLLYQGRHFRDLTFDELSRGLKAHFWVESATHKVAHLQIDMPVLGRRTVKAFDRAQARLTLEETDGERVLKIAPHVKLVGSDGRPAAPDVRPKAVSCALSPDRTTAEIIVVLEK